MTPPGEVGAYRTGAIGELLYLHVVPELDDRKRADRPMMQIAHADAGE
jgi:hypothetical protein